MKWFSDLANTLGKTRESFFGRVRELFRRGDITEDLWSELEDLLLEADVGVGATQDLVAGLKSRAREERLKDSWKLFEIFKEEIARLLGGIPSPIRLAAEGPTVILTVGVNGSGKTTTIGKLAAYFRSQGKKVFLAAADTFRAAAIEQLEAWSERAGAEIIKHREGADPAAVAYDAVVACRARRGDLILIDTAGRLHTKTNLMEELRKIRRVIQKEIPEAPHETLLILDAVTGQNALNQARIFKEAVEVTGIVLTKLDGSAKGGALLAIRRELDLPIKFVGVGEKAADLQAFDPRAFAEALLTQPEKG